MNDDSYGTVLREKMKESMSEPAAVFKPYNRVNRRRSWWMRRGEDVRFLVWMSFLLLAGSLFWLSLAGVLKWFK